MGKNNLLSCITATAVLSLAGVSLVKSLVDGHYNSLPGVVYLVNGQEVMERRFKTNEEFQDYLNSEQGKKEQEYYSAMNNRVRHKK